MIREMFAIVNRVYRGARYFLFGTFSSVYDQPRGAFNVFLLVRKGFIDNCLLPNLAMLYGRFCGAWPIAYRLLFLLHVLFRNQRKINKKTFSFFGGNCCSIVEN